MNAVFYQVYDDNNVINKVKNNPVEYEIQFHEVTSIFRPMIKLHCTDNFTSNYVYIERWKRYYFINSVEIYPNGIYHCYLECDVLESFKEQIFDCYGFINRQKQNMNLYYDKEYESEVRKESDLYYSDVNLPETESILLTTVGG